MQGAFDFEKWIIRSINPVIPHAEIFFYSRRNYKYNEILIIFGLPS